MHSEEAKKDVSLCIVIPCYNEASRLPVEEIQQFIDGSRDVTLCFANDGSTDATIKIISKLEEINKGRVIVVDNKNNQGKAETIRQAVLKVSDILNVKYIGYLDADMSTPFREMIRMYEVASLSGGNTLIMGCRLRRLGADVVRGNLRHYLGRIFATLTSISLHLPVYDTQCGAKIIESRTAKSVMQKPFLSNWFFDIEIIKRVLIEQRTFSRSTIIELPLNYWRAKDGSKLKPIYYIKAPFELLKIHLHYQRPKIDYNALPDQ